MFNQVPQEILKSFVCEHKHGFCLTIKVKPNASIEKLAHKNLDELCLSVKAPASDNAANKRVIELMAALFSVSKGRVSIINGLKSSIKRILIKNV